MMLTSFTLTVLPSHLMPQALFLAYGPDLQQGLQIEPFQNIELYNLMCQLTGVEPAKNNGTWGALNHALARPAPMQHMQQVR